MKSNGSAQSATQRAQKSIADADAVSNLINHIAWTDTLQPRMLALRERLVKQLVATVLGRPALEQVSQSHAVPLTPEALAGRIAGIDHQVDLMEKILSEADKAEEIISREISSVQ